MVWHYPIHNACNLFVLRRSILAMLSKGDFGATISAASTTTTTTTALTLLPSRVRI